MRIAHITWNFVGLAVPLVVAAISVPELINKLGQERFGLLALAWGLIGYAGALDLGIGRATTHLVSKFRSGNEAEKLLIPTVRVTAIKITSLVGFFGFLIIFCAGLLGVGNLINAAQVDPNEILISILVLSVALPLQTISATYRGVNEAYLNFKGISMVRAFLGVANFGVPLAMTNFSEKIYYLIGSLVVSRVIALLAFKMLADRCVEDAVDLGKAQFSIEIAKKMTTFGGWFTISSIINPAVGIADRFIISAVISVGAVSVYAIPYEMVAQSLIVVGAITTVMFPFFSQLRTHAPTKVMGVFYRALGASLVIVLMITFSYHLIGDSILRLWLGVEMNEEMVGILKTLSFGLVPYTVGTLCTSLLHSNGKTKLTAQINIIEFPFFLMLIYCLTNEFGILGAAYAWVLRVTIDAAIFLYYAVSDK